MNEATTPLWRCPIMRRAKDVLKHWDTIREDDSVTAVELADCAPLLAKALRDMVQLAETTEVVIG